MPDASLSLFQLKLMPSRYALVGINLSAIAATLVTLFSFSHSLLVSMVALLNLLFLWWVWRVCGLRLRAIEGTLWLNYEGDIRLQLAAESIEAELTDACLSADWGCRLVYRRYGIRPSACETLWLFRDNLSDADYRRLNRVLCYHRQRSTQNQQ